MKKARGLALGLAFASVMAIGAFAEAPEQPNQDIQRPAYVQMQNQNQNKDSVVKHDKDKKVKHAPGIKKEGNVKEHPKKEGFKKDSKTHLQKSEPNNHLKKDGPKKHTKKAIPEQNQQFPNGQTQNQ